MIEAVLRDWGTAVEAPHRVAELKDVGVFVVEREANADKLSEIALVSCEILTADRPA